jgi:hypothetical protein
MRDEDDLQDSGAPVVCALLENRAKEAWLANLRSSCRAARAPEVSAVSRRQVGVAVLDLSAPGLFLSQSVEQASYTNTLALLRDAHTPSVIILCGQAASSTGIARLAATFFQGAKLVSLKRSIFDDTRGRSVVRRTRARALPRTAKLRCRARFAVARCASL